MMSLKHLSTASQAMQSKHDVQTQEEFNTVPMDEFGKYIEEVGLTPYAQY